MFLLILEHEKIKYKNYMHEVKNVIKKQKSPEKL